MFPYGKLQHMSLVFKSVYAKTSAIYVLIVLWYTIKSVLVKLYVLWLRTCYKMLFLIYNTEHFWSFHAGTDCEWLFWSTIRGLMHHEANSINTVNLKALNYKVIRLGKQTNGPCVTFIYFMLTVQVQIKMSCHDLFLGTQMKHNNVYCTCKRICRPDTIFSTGGITHLSHQFTVTSIKHWETHRLLNAAVSGFIIIKIQFTPHLSLKFSHSARHVWVTDLRKVQCSSDSDSVGIVTEWGDSVKKK